jgi:outer membrane protein TolC/ABC-type uncharacterized transport system substrate-binding protein
MTVRRIVPALVAAAALLPALAPAAEPPRVRIGIVVDGPWAGNQGVRELTSQEVRALTEGDFEVEFPDQAYRVGDWTYETAKQSIDQLLEDPAVDLVIAWGVLASHAACCYVNLPKPIVAPVVLNPELQGLPYDNGVSGLANLSYVSLEEKIGRDFEVFREIVPLEKIAFLGNRAFVEAIPELPMRTLQLTAELGYSVEFIHVGSSVDEALAAIAEDTDAAYLNPLFHLPPEDLQRLIDGLNERRLPTFSALGSLQVQAGVLATATSDDFFPRLTRRVALNVQRILLGEDGGALPVDFSFREEVVLNMATARKIGVSPSWDVLVEARLLHPEGEDLPGMSMQQAVEEAVRVNLDLLAQQRAVSAGEEEVRRARSVFLPQLDISALAIGIDKDRAAASFGSQAEQSLTGSAGLSQLLFSESARANLEVQRLLQVGRAEDWQTVRLDVTLDAAVTYLNLLRAKTLVQIQRNNLELTRSNLQLAEIRRTIGAANPAEVFRWESQIATDRKALIEGMASQRVAEFALNRILHRPLEERFVTAEVGLDDPDLITGQERFTGYTDTPRRFRVLRDFIVEQGLLAAPELQQLNAAIQAQRRALVAAKRAYWAPTLGLQADFDEVLSKEGAGSAPGLGAPFFELPTLDDTSWSIGLQGSLSLFSGGARRADVRQTEQGLMGLQIQYQALEEKIEQRMRSGMEVARASFSGIELSQKAAAAARKSLELVSDAYARGAVSILDLLDSQNAALNAEQLAANAIYDFFIDLMEVQRAGNRFDFFLGAEEREVWYERLERYFEAHGLSPGGS